MKKKYSKDHIWIIKEKDAYILGLTHFGKEQIGEVTFIEFPKVGEKIEKNGILCIIESSKAATDVISPFSGSILAINEELKKNIDLINSFPEEKGWICKMKPSNFSSLNSLLSKEEYEKLK